MDLKKKKILEKSELISGLHLFPGNALLSNCFVPKEQSHVIAIDTALHCSVHVCVRHPLLEAVLQLRGNRLYTTEACVDSWVKLKSLSISVLKFKNALRVT